MRSKNEMMRLTKRRIKFLKKQQNNIIKRIIKQERFLRYMQKTELRGRPK